jgi:hypothetical protein
MASKYIGAIGKLGQDARGGPAGVGESLSQDGDLVVPVEVFKATHGGEK